MKIIMNDLQLTVWTGAVVAHFIVVSRNSPTETVDIHEESLSGQPTLGSHSKCGLSEFRSGQLPLHQQREFIINFHLSLPYAFWSLSQWS